MRIAHMIRTVFRDTRLLFGPLRESDLAVIAHEPLFEGHGLCASASTQGVEVYVTLPNNSRRLLEVQSWYLRNHQMLG